MFGFRIRHLGVLGVRVVFCVSSITCWESQPASVHIAQSCGCSELLWCSLGLLCRLFGALWCSGGPGLFGVRAIVPLTKALALDAYIVLSPCRFACKFCSRCIYRNMAVQLIWLRSVRRGCLCPDHTILYHWCHECRANGSLFSYDQWRAAFFTQFAHLCSPWL